MELENVGDAHKPVLTTVSSFDYAWCRDASIPFVLRDYVSKEVYNLVCLCIGVPNPESDLSSIRS